MDLNAVGHLEDVRHVVADEDDAQTAVAELPHDVEHLLGLPDPERRGRLVENDHPTAERHRPRDGHGLTLPAGKGLHHLRDVLDGSDPQGADLFLGLSPHRAVVEHPQHASQRATTAHLAAEEEIGRDVEFGREGQVLVHRFDPGRTGVLRAAEAHLGSRHGDGANVRNLRPRQTFDQGRLPGPVVTDQRKDLARVQVDVNPVEGDHRPVGLDQSSGGECRRAVGRRGHRVAPVRRIHWSSATAAMISSPIASVW